MTYSEGVINICCDKNFTNFVLLILPKCKNFLILNVRLQIQRTYWFDIEYETLENDVGKLGKLRKRHVRWVILYRLGSVTHNVIKLFNSRNTLFSQKLLQAML